MHGFWELTVVQMLLQTGPSCQSWAPLANPMSQHFQSWVYCSQQPGLLCTKENSLRILLAALFATAWPGKWSGYPSMLGWMHASWSVCAGEYWTATAGMRFCKGLFSLSTGFMQARSRILCLFSIQSLKNVRTIPGSYMGCTETEAARQMWPMGPAQLAGLCYVAAGHSAAACNDSEGSHTRHRETEARHRTFRQSPDMGRVKLQC